MRYKIKPLPTKKSDPKWKVQLVSYKREDILKHRGKSHKSDRVTIDVKKSEWYHHGFKAEMTIDQAKERAKQLNSQTELDERRRARAAIQERFEQEDLVECAYLPPKLVDDFVEKLKVDFYGDDEEFSRSKTVSHWRAVKRVIRKLELDPNEWEDNKLRFYKLFASWQWSTSYVQKIIILLNKWGYFCAKRNNVFYTPLPFPTGRHRQKIADAYYDSDKTIKESKPLKKSHLMKARNGMTEEQYNWMFISFWFGLRPKEVDSLIGGKDSTWSIGTQRRKKVLRVYQPKLVGVDASKRWKVIPCIFKEQLEALKLIQGQNFKRPLVKTIKRYIGEGYNTYAGRKGFESLLLAEGVPFEAISAYMGHLDVNRTWNSYRDRNRAVLPEDFRASKILSFDKKSKKKSAA